MRIDDLPHDPPARRRDVAVVIPTFRRPDLLARCLVAVGLQTLAASRFEVVVADDDPFGPRSLALCETLAAIRGRFPHLRIHYLPVAGTQGPAAARNAGWRIARARVIAFTDDDTVPEPGWLAAGLDALDAGYDALGGRIAMPLGTAPTDYERDASHLAAAEFATANCFVRADALAAVRGFDERFTSAWREDSDLQFSLIERGFRVGTTTDACVLHPIRPERYGVSVRQQRKVYFDALLYKKHRALVRERIAYRAPLDYYASVAALAVVAIAVVVGAWSVARIAAFAWLLLGLAFAARRLRGTSHAAAHVGEMIVTSLLLPPLSLYWRLRGAWHFRVPFL